MEKSFKAIAQAKQDGETVQYYIRDLNTWENEMKQKEAALKDEQAQQVLPPVRNRQRRDKYRKKNNRKRPAGTDQHYEVFDPNKPYEEMEDVGPLSLTLDLKQSEVIKQMQVKEEAHYQKERGNKFVKVERWDDAIACYNRAIQLVKDDAIYYANRGLCYLKKDSLHQAEQDCTEALRLDPTYVKALQRRATARERLGSLRAATADLSEVIKLEPHNVAAKRQLESIKQRMGTKGRKAKTSPVTKPSWTSSPEVTGKPKPNLTQKPTSQDPQANIEGQDAPQAKTVSKTPHVPPGKIFGVPQASQIELDMKPTPIMKVEVNNGSNMDNWKDGVGENVLVIKPVKKPPHLRSKRALKTIPIREIPLGKTVEDLEKPATRMKIIEIDNSQGDTNNNDKNQTDNTTKDEKPKETIKTVERPIETIEIVEKPKQIIETVEKPKQIIETVEKPKQIFETVEKPKQIFETVEKPKQIFETVEKPKQIIETVEKPKQIIETAEKPKQTIETVEKPKPAVDNRNNVINEANTNDVKKNDLKENVKIENNFSTVSKNDMVAPTNSVQFMSKWRNLRGDDRARCAYLSLLEPFNIPKVFANALESAVLSEIIYVLYNYKGSLRPRVTAYLKGLARVKRLSALVMFLAASDKELLNKLLVHCKTAEDCSDEDIAELKFKYEL